MTDSLTGLHNRRYMETHLATLVEQASARGKPLALLVLDIDHFKSVNDNHGHDARDDVLREFALRVRRSIRGINLACRYGGEEFVVVMPQTDMAVAATVAKRVRRRIAGEPFGIGHQGETLNVTISIGLASLVSPADNRGDYSQARGSGAVSCQAGRAQSRGRAATRPKAGSKRGRQAV